MRLQHSFLSALVALAVVAGALPAQLKKGVHFDEEKGYKVAPPPKWKQVPVDIDEKWIVLKYIAHRSYPSKSTGAEHRPQMRVIVFPHDAFKESGVSVKQRGDVTVTNVRDRAYRDYKDYVKRNQEAGYFFTEETECERAGVNCWQYEVKLEKNAGVPRRYVTWVFKGTTADYAVEFEVLEDLLDKQKPEAVRSLETFEFIARTGSTALGGTTGQNGGARPGGGAASTTDLDPFDYVDRAAWKALPAEDRAKRKKDIEQRRWKHSNEALTAGWKSNTTKNFLFLSHCDTKYTKKIADAAEACWGWLESEFGEVSDEYVMRNIIRICADSEEARAYVRGSGDERSFDPKDREIVIWRDVSMGSAGGYENLYYYLLLRYLVDKDVLVYLYLPPWIRTGLEGVVRKASPNRKRLALDADPNESVLIRIHQKNEGLPSVRELMEMGYEKFNDRTTGTTYRALSTKWVRWLMSKEAAKDPLTKSLIVDYIRETVKVASEIESERLAGRREANSEAEEEAQAKARENAEKVRFARVIKQLQDVSFKWTDEQWTSLDKSFRKALSK